MYTVSDILDDLSGHESQPDREIKIKLKDGTTLDIAGFQFINSCIGGNDTIYICEGDELWNKYGDEVISFILNGYKIAKACDEIIEDRSYEITDFALDCIMTVAAEADHWLERLGIEHDMQPRTGPDKEIFDKLKLLKKWYDAHLHKEYYKL